jgi:hypothetical protein
MDCDIDPSSLCCRACGATVSAPHVRRNCGTPPAAPPAGLGDYVARILYAIGITKERVEAVVGGPCGCDQRAALLNEAGAKWLGMSPGSTAPPEIDPGTP